jgi:hypothetical protein
MRRFGIPDGEPIRLTNRLKNAKPFPWLSPIFHEGQQRKTKSAIPPDWAASAADVASTLCDNHNRRHHSGE